MTRFNSITFNFFLWFNFRNSHEFATTFFNTRSAKVFFARVTVEIEIFDFNVIEALITFNCNCARIWIFIYPRHLVVVEAKVILNILHSLIFFGLSFHLVDFWSSCISDYWFLLFLRRTKVRQQKDYTINWYSYY